jgi:hypothetical protein
VESCLEWAGSTWGYSAHNGIDCARDNGARRSVGGVMDRAVTVAKVCVRDREGARKCGYSEDRSRDGYVTQVLRN